VSQSRAGSAIETTLNIGSGALVAWALTYWVLPMWGYAYSAGQAVEITALYTAVSWLRSFMWRRGFNWVQGRKQ
jgi:apolipoprotein N-acyltransferase